MKSFNSKVLGVLLIMFAFCLQPQRIQAQQEEPWQLIGVWNLDFTLSPLFDGAPPQTRTLKYWWEGDQLKHTVHLVSAEGEHRLGGWTVDRNIKTISGPNPTVKRLDAYSSQIINIQDGKVRNLLTRIAWKDGKHMTFVRQRPDANGVLTVYGVEVFNKQ